MFSAIVVFPYDSPSAITIQQYSNAWIKHPKFNNGIHEIRETKKIELQSLITNGWTNDFILHNSIYVCVYIYIKLYTIVYIFPYHLPSAITIQRYSNAWIKRPKFNNWRYSDAWIKHPKFNNWIRELRETKQIEFQSLIMNGLSNDFILYDSIYVLHNSVCIYISTKLYNSI